MQNEPELDHQFLEICTMAGALLKWVGGQVIHVCSHSEIPIPIPCSLRDRTPEEPTARGGEVGG